MLHNRFLIQELLEWFNCPKKAFHLHYFGASSIIQASYLREQARVIQSFITTHSPRSSKPYFIKASTLEDSITESLDLIKSKKETHLINAVIADSAMAILIPYMYKNANMDGWNIFIPVSANGLKQDHLNYATFVMLLCEKLEIPISKILLSFFQVNQLNSSEWVPTDITSKLKKHYTKEQNLFTHILTLINSPDVDDETQWHRCTKQYCDYCDNEGDYEIDDIRTLRKAKQFIDELKLQGIKKITEIPADKIPNSNVINRQIQSVILNQPLYIELEVKELLQELKFPRYYLDFEAFSTSIPYNYSAPYLSIPRSYTPFLYSLQKQEYEKGPIHTMLWAMIPGKNQIKLLWESLKPHLLAAGSIIVYDSQFERDMILQLSTALSENQKGDDILKKIIDLQKLFYNLSVYNPEQKGKISLKTISPIWAQGSYQDFKVNEGISANYFFTSLTDEALGIFNDIKKHPYISEIFKRIYYIKHSITLKDIVNYCKYDTEVMIRIVDVLENWNQKTHHSID